MLKVIFYIKTEKANKKGESPIFAKISYRGETTTLSTGKSISKERWLATNRLRSILKIEREKVLKQSLENIAISVEKTFNDLLKADFEVSLSELKKTLGGKDRQAKEKSIGILKLFDIHNSYFKKKVESGERSKASMQKYERAKELVQVFIKKNYGTNKFNIKEINGAFIYNLESFLKYESNYKGKIGIKNNSVVKYFKNFKTVCNYCIKIEVIDRNPFKSYDGKLNVKDAVFLTQQELDSIEHKIQNKLFNRTYINNFVIFRVIMIMIIYPWPLNLNQLLFSTSVRVI